MSCSFKPAASTICFIAIMAVGGMYESYFMAPFPFQMLMDERNNIAAWLIAVLGPGKRKEGGRTWWVLGMEGGDRIEMYMLTRLKCGERLIVITIKRLQLLED